MFHSRPGHQIDPDTGAILRTIQSNRFVTGVTWVDGELWHGTWEGDDADIRAMGVGGLLMEIASRPQPREPHE